MACFYIPGVRASYNGKVSATASSLSFLQRARRAVLPQEEEGSAAGQLTPEFSKKEGNGCSTFHPLLPYSREGGPRKANQVLCTVPGVVGREEEHKACP